MNYDRAKWDSRFEYRPGSGRLSDFNWMWGASTSTGDINVATQYRATLQQQVNKRAATCVPHPTWPFTHSLFTKLCARSTTRVIQLNTDDRDHGHTPIETLLKFWNTDTHTLPTPVWTVQLSKNAGNSHSRAPGVAAADYVNTSYLFFLALRGLWWRKRDKTQ